MNKTRKDSFNIKRLNTLIKRNPIYGKIAEESLERLISDVSLENIVTDSEYIKALAKLTRDTELRWLIIKDHLLMKCPVCKSKIDMGCAVSRCHICDTEIMIKSNALIGICENRCAAYKNTCKGAIETDAPYVLIKRLRNNKKSRQIKQYD